MTNEIDVTCTEFTSCSDWLDCESEAFELHALRFRSATCCWAADGETGIERQRTLRKVLGESW